MRYGLHAGILFRKGELIPPQPDPEAMEELRKAVKKKKEQRSHG